MATLKVVAFFDAKGAAANLNVTERKFRSWANGQVTKAEIAAGLTLANFPKAAIKSGKQNWSNKLLTAWAKAHNAALVKLGHHCVSGDAKPKKQRIQTVGTVELSKEYGITTTTLKLLAKAKGIPTKSEAAAGLSLVGFPEPIKVGTALLWPKTLIRSWFSKNAVALKKLGYVSPLAKDKKPNAAAAIKPKSLKQPVEKSSKKVEDTDRAQASRGSKRVKSTFIAELKLNDKYTLSPLGSEVKSITLDLGEAGTVQSGARALATLLSAVSIGVSVRSVKVAKAAKADEALLHAWLADVAAVAGVHNSVLVEWEGSIGKAVIQRKLEIAKK